MGDNRALISAFVIVILAILFAYTLWTGLKETKRRQTEDVFGDPARTQRAWYWSVLGICSVLLLWFYFSWGTARSFFPDSGNELCQVAKVDAGLAPLVADLPQGERYFKSTVLLQRNRAQLESLSASMGRMAFTDAERGAINGYIADANAYMASVSDPAQLSPVAEAELESITAEIRAITARLAGDDYAANAASVIAEGRLQPKWGTTAKEIPLTPVTIKGVELDGAAAELEALSKRFVKIRNASPEVAAEVKRLKATGKQLLADIKAAEGFSEAEQDARNKLVKTVTRVFTRVSGGRIFPPEALSPVQAAVTDFEKVKRDEQGGLRLVRRLFFNGGSVVKGNVACTEQGSGRWLPKPADVLAVVGKMANPNEGYKGIPLFWYQWVPLADVGAFFAPDWIADALPGEYPVHNEDGTVTPNLKSKVLAFAQGNYESPSIPLLTGHVWDSIFRVLMGLFFGIFLGVPLGILMGVSRFYKGFFDPLVELYRPVPPLAWAPLILTIFGIQDDGKIFLLFMVAFAIMIISARTGATGTQLSKIRASHSLGASTGQMIRHVILPNAMPEILTGTRIAIGVCWGTLVAAEMLAGTTGIGFVENVARKQSDYEVIWVTILIMGLLGLFFDLIMRWLIARLIPWRGKG